MKGKARVKKARPGSPKEKKTSAKGGGNKRTNNTNKGAGKEKGCPPVPRVQVPTHWKIPQLRAATEAELKTSEVKAQLTIYRQHRGPPAPEAAYKCVNEFHGHKLNFACRFFAKGKEGFCFSNFFTTPVTLYIRGFGLHTFPSAEHAYMWSVRVFPVNSSVEALRNWTVGGKYAVPAEGANSKAKQIIGLRAKKQANAMTKAGTAAVSPFYIGVPVQQMYEHIWSHLLGAKFTQNKRLHRALEGTGDNLLVEWSRGFSQSKFGGYLKQDGKGSYKVPMEHASALHRCWVTNVWAGSLIPDPANGVTHAFGYNVMGVCLTKLRRQLFGTKSRKWPNQIGQYSPDRESYVIEEERWNP